MSRHFQSASILGAGFLFCTAGCSPKAESSAASHELEELRQRVQRLEERLDTAEAPTPSSNDESLPEGFEAFLTAVWRHNGSNDATEWAGDFAENAAYAYAPGRKVTRAFIAVDRQKLIARYPTRRYSKLNISDIKVVNPDTVHAMMDFSYEYTGTKRVAGQAKTALICERINGEWKITGFEETIVRPSK